MQKKIIALIVVFILVFSAVAVTAVVIRVNANNSIANFTLQQEALNNTAWQQVKNSGWAKYGESYAIGVEINENLTLRAEQNAISDSLANEQSNITQSNNLIYVSLIGFGCTGIAVVIGYSIHKHTVNMIKKSAKS